MLQDKVCAEESYPLLILLTIFSFMTFEKMEISLDSFAPSTSKLLPTLCVSVMHFYSEEYKSCA